MLSYLLLAAAVIWVGMGTLKWEPLSRLRQVVIPVYAIVLFFVQMEWGMRDTQLLVPVIIIAAGIGWAQTLTLQLRATEDTDKKGRPVVLARKGWAYVIGWVAIVGLGIAAHMYIEGGLTSEELQHEVLSEVTSELSSFFLFSREANWYVWALAGVSSVVYLLRLRRLNPRPGNGLAHRSQRR